MAKKTQAPKTIPSKNSSTARPSVKRKHIRFAADVGTLAYILTDTSGKKLSKPIPALVVDEAYGGCSLIIVKNPQFHEDAQFKVKVGNLNTMSAVIRWMKNFENKVMMIGVAYLDQ